MSVLPTEGGKAQGWARGADFTDDGVNLLLPSTSGPVAPLQLLGGTAGGTAPNLTSYLSLFTLLKKYRFGEGQICWHKLRSRFCHFLSAMCHIVNGGRWCGPQESDVEIESHHHIPHLPPNMYPVYERQWLEIRLLCQRLGRRGRGPGCTWSCTTAIGWKTNNVTREGKHEIGALRYGRTSHDQPRPMVNM
jgi:hypothetical protein